MTNRAKIMEELAAMDNEGFFDAMSDNRVTTAMENHQCEDCKARWGDCPAVDDGLGPCRVSTEDWMDWECVHQRLLPYARA